MQKDYADVEAISSLLNLVAALLAVSAAAVTIGYSFFQRAKTAAAKERVVSSFYTFTAAGLNLTGLALWLVAGLPGVGLCFYLLGIALVSINFLRKREPSSRPETLFLVFSWCATTLLVGFYYLGWVFDTFDRIIGVLGKLAGG